MQLEEIPVRVNGIPRGLARVNLGHVTWLCRCGSPVPLVARLDAKNSYTKCHQCERVYVIGREAESVDDVTTDS